MKLSGHNFNNEVFDSLLDQLSDQIELKKTAKQEAPKVESTSFFSETTKDSLSNLHADQLDFIAGELTYAAEKSRIAVNSEDLAKFASQVQLENLKGKQMERAAAKYCNNLDRAMAAPQGMTRISSSDLIDQLASHKVVPAGYDPSVGQNNSITGRYMGSSMNPNTIWDTDALTKQASIPLGDEKIKASKEARKKEVFLAKTAQWQELQDKHSEPDQITKRITNTGTGSNDVVKQNMPENTMSIFSDNRDFENIPAHTVGELIAKQAEDRANRRIEASKEERNVNKPMNTRDLLDNLFEG